MTISLATESKNVVGASTVTLIDAGDIRSSGYIEIKSGTKPDNPQLDSTDSSTLATLTFSNPAYGEFSNGSALVNPITSGVAVAQGIATWFRIYNRNEVAILDGNITITGQGGDIELDNIKILTGGTVQLISLNAKVQ